MRHRAKFVVRKIMAYQKLKLEDADPSILRIRLCRPEVRNVMDEQVIAELTKVFQKDLPRLKKIRAVVLQGEGPAFCGGGDLNWMERAARLKGTANLKDTQALAKMFELVLNCKVPVLAAVQGAAFGGGLGLVGACDWVVASRETWFSFSEVRLGLVPAVIMPLVLPKIGLSHARALFLTGERFQADKALHVGLIHAVVEKDDDLEQSVQAQLANIRAGGPVAVTYAKELLLNHRNIGQTPTRMAKHLAQLRISKEGREGVRAFLEKRKASWNE